MSSSTSLSKNEDSCLYIVFRFYHFFTSFRMLPLSCVSSTSGEEQNSFGYGGTGKFSSASKFTNFGETFGKGDVIMAMVDFTTMPPRLTFMKNGVWLGVAENLHQIKAGSKTHALFPHILSKNCRYVSSV